MINSINSNTGFSVASTAAIQKKQNEALERLSTMLRINRAKDDAAGSSIVQRQTAQILGNRQGIRNASDGISFAQIAEGSLSSVSENLQRMRELAVQAANPTNRNQPALQSEVNQLSTENKRIAQTTSFAGQAVFSGNSQSISFQVGADAESNNQISAELNSLDNLNSVNPDNGGIDLSSPQAAQQAIEQIDADLEQVNQQAAEFGALQNRFSAAIENGEISAVNGEASRSRLRDADVAKELSKLIQSQILQQANTAVTSQANQSKKLVLSLLGGR